MRFPVSFATAIAPILFAGLVMAASAGHSAAQEPPGFVAAIEDLPLMPGLAEEEGGIEFDTARGRIVEAFATGQVSEDAVRAFYDETLPQLGWRPLGRGSFQRENEILAIEFPGGHGAAPPLTVGFRLMPAGE